MTPLHISCCVRARFVSLLSTISCWEWAPVGGYYGNVREVQYNFFSASGLPLVAKYIGVLLQHTPGHDYYFCFLYTFAHGFRKIEKIEKDSSCYSLSLLSCQIRFSLMGMRCDISVAYRPRRFFILEIYLQTGTKSGDEVYTAVCIRGCSCCAGRRGKEECRSCRTTETCKCVCSESVTSASLYVIILTSSLLPVVIMEHSSSYRHKRCNQQQRWTLL